MSHLVKKPTKRLVRLAKTQISLGIRPGWSVFAVRMKKPWVPSYPLGAQRRLWSDWADAQADLSLRWAHMSVCRFCHEVARMFAIVDRSTKFWDSRSWMFCRFTKFIGCCNVTIFLFWLGLYVYVFALKQKFQNHTWKILKSNSSVLCYNWTASSECGTYRLCEQWVKRNLQTESQISVPSEWLGMHS